jgi:hypothetical protein
VDINKGSSKGDVMIWRMDHTFDVSEESREIYIRLEHYDDIFSDFDMRPYARRALSVDFLEEIKRAVDGKNVDGIELMLHVPEKHRDSLHEKDILDRLSAHFARHFQLLAHEKRTLLGTGICMVILGILCMVWATLFVFEDPTRDLVKSFLVVFLEPAAWFLLWEGMDQIIFNAKKINPELNFYRKMTQSSRSMNFKSY